MRCSLKAKDKDGNILAELGKCDAKGVRKASCVLPGGKRAMNEVPQVASAQAREHAHAGGGTSGGVNCAGCNAARDGQAFALLAGIDSP
eukprot:2728263-Amphidinium_carterae.1